MTAALGLIGSGLRGIAGLGGFSLAGFSTTGGFGGAAGSGFGVCRFCKLYDELR